MRRAAGVGCRCTHAMAWDTIDRRPSRTGRTTVEPMKSSIDCSSGTPCSENMEGALRGFAEAVEAIEPLYGVCTDTCMEVARDVVRGSFLRAEYLPSVGVADVAHLQTAHRAHMEAMMQRCCVSVDGVWDRLVGAARGIAEGLRGREEDDRSLLVAHLAARAVHCAAGAFFVLRGALHTLWAAVEGSGMDAARRGPNLVCASFAGPPSPLRAALESLPERVALPMPMPFASGPPPPETLRLTASALECKSGWAPAELERLLKALVLAARSIKA